MKLGFLAVKLKKNVKMTS